MLVKPWKVNNLLNQVFLNMILNSKILCNLLNQVFKNIILNSKLLKFFKLSEDFPSQSRIFISS